MKGKFGLYVCAIFYLVPMYFTISSTLYSAGSWCPYQVEKVVPCRVRNGTERYYGTNICWRNENGSYACTKKLMYRPRYTTTYKKVRETKYKCCPGRDGAECENECFNCSTFRKLEERVNAQEKRLGRMEKSLLFQKSTRDFSSENSVYPPSTSPPYQENDKPSSSEGSALSLAYATLNLRVQTILDEFREMQNRIRYLENEVSRLNMQVDDLSLSSNIAYDYGGGGGGSSSSFHGNKDIRNNPEVVSTPPIRKDSPNTQTHQNEMRNDEGNEPGDWSITTTTVIPGHHHHHRHNHNHHHQQHQQNNHQNFNNHHHSSSSSSPSSGKSESGSSPFRVLEENLERGDIASTLNDDYGDDLYNDNSTEQYIDQLQAKREQHLP